MVRYDLYVLLPKTSNPSTAYKQTATQLTLGQIYRHLLLCPPSWNTAIVTLTLRTSHEFIYMTFSYHLAFFRCQFSVQCPSSLWCLVFLKYPWNVSIDCKNVHYSVLNLFASRWWVWLSISLFNPCRPSPGQLEYTYLLVGINYIKTRVHVYVCLSWCEGNEVDQCRDIHTRRINVL